jgi:hypothetical protein
VPGVPDAAGLARLADLAGLIGRAMLAAGVALVLVALLLVLPGAVRVRRRALALREATLAAHGDALVALALLEAQTAERRALLEPWRRLLRWARHPLVVATVEWYSRHRRRRAAADAARAHG